MSKRNPKNDNEIFVNKTTSAFFFFFSLLRNICKKCKNCKNYSQYNSEWDFYFLFVLFYVFYFYFQTPTTPSPSFQSPRFYNSTNDSFPSPPPPISNSHLIPLIPISEIPPPLLSPILNSVNIVSSLSDSRDSIISMQESEIKSGNFYNLSLVFLSVSSLFLFSYFFFCWPCLFFRSK